MVVNDCLDMDRQTSESKCLALCKCVDTNTEAHNALVDANNRLKRSQGGLEAEL